MGEHKQTKKIISMVPSWTETLVESGLDVVGRTRFCIHPKGRVQSIPRLGGTKDIRWDRIPDSGGNILLLDKEENPRWMTEQSPIEVVTTHVQNLQDLQRDLALLATEFQSVTLEQMAHRLENVLHQPMTVKDVTHLPGVISWLRKPVQPIEKIIYVIWRNPWMGVSAETFIGSVFQKLGQQIWSAGEGRYPKLDLEKIADQKSLLLFSSEPYNFQKESQTLPQYFDSPMALVHGDLYSWFGIRTLRFLEAIAEIFS